jgi:hypothetical protein
MARGDHPMRTPFYGALLIVAAMLAGTAVTAWTHPSALVRGIVLGLALVVALIGFGLTFRDLTPPRR